MPGASGKCGAIIGPVIKKRGLLLINAHARFTGDPAFNAAECSGASRFDIQIVLQHVQTLQEPRSIAASKNLPWSV